MQVVEFESVRRFRTAREKAASANTASETRLNCLQVDSKRLWNRLYATTQRLVVSKDENGVYHLVQEAAGDTGHSTEQAA